MNESPNIIPTAPPHQGASQVDEDTHKPASRLKRIKLDPSLKILKPSETNNHTRIKAKEHQADYTLRPFQKIRPRVLAIGSSTGGPIALKLLLESIGSALNHIPIVITQHMPPLFTPVLATNLAKSTGLTAMEGVDGEVLRAGTIYVAPGSFHMTIVKNNNRPTIALNQDPPVNFCRPSVEPMFSSLSGYYGASVLAAVLTGMGSDGSQGALDVANAGGNVIAQDEATSMVWGMPKAAAHTGACFAVQSINDMAATISNIITQGVLQ